jgi:predicted RNA-binding Zn ribbon-like protein
MGGNVHRLNRCLQHHLYWCCDECFPFRPRARDAGLPRDRWIAEAGIAVAPCASGQQLDDARELREAIRRVLDCARDGGRPGAPDLRLVNEWARRPVAAPQIGPGLARVSAGPDPVTGALAHIARESVELVTGPELRRVRACAGCTLLFIDRSRPGTRRWCSMERCGNRNKTAHYRQKRRT